MAKKRITAGMVLDQVLDYGKDATKAAIDAVTGDRRRKANNKTDKQQQQALAALTAEVRHLAQRLAAAETGKASGTSGNRRDGE
ncbi:hypothetical protein [Streptomyces sp. NPDC018045]|uniref:hypothetical protein n=1 Tax=Streptomyces sp. NPDC018045 TaxID=3365037 RepID=UPI003796EC39